MKKIVLCLLMLMLTAPVFANEAKKITPVQAAKDLEYQLALERLPDNAATSSNRVRALFDAYVADGMKPIDAAEKVVKWYKEKQAELDKRVGPMPEPPPKKKGDFWIETYPPTTTPLN